MYVSRNIIGATVTHKRLGACRDPTSSLISFDQGLVKKLLPVQSAPVYITTCLSRQFSATGGKIILMKNRCAFVLFFFSKDPANTQKNCVWDIVAAVNQLSWSPTPFHHKTTTVFFHYWSVGEERRDKVRSVAAVQLLKMRNAPPLLTSRCYRIFEMKNRDSSLNESEL